MIFNFILEIVLKPLSANFTKWSNTLRQFVGKLPKNCLSVFDHFVGMALKELNKMVSSMFKVSAVTGNTPSS